MSYIAFLDMVGIQSSAMISSAEYTKAIDDFNTTLQMVHHSFPCTIYGYSDNAYIEFNSLHIMVNFLRLFREMLMKKHRYFTAAVDKGSLDATTLKFHPHQSFSMKFTSPSTVDIYLQQSQFSGIGVSLSSAVVGELNKKDFCQSVFQKRFTTEDSTELVPIYDLSYNKASLPALRFIIEDYLITTATDSRAGRYYITPIISMIKSLKTDELQKEETDLIALISLKKIPKFFSSLPSNNLYSIYFVFALLDTVLSLREFDQSFDGMGYCQRIIEQQDCSTLIEMLPSISTAIIKNENKHYFLKVLYNMDKSSL